MVGGTAAAAAGGAGAGGAGAGVGVGSTIAAPPPRRRIGYAFRLQEGEQFFRTGVFGGFFTFLQHRVLHDLLVDHLLKLQAVKLEHGDHLDEAGGQNLLLRNFKLESGRQ